MGTAQNYDEYQRWLNTEHVKKYNTAIKQQERERITKLQKQQQQIVNPQFNSKEILKPPPTLPTSEKFLNSNASKLLDSFNQQTTQLPLRGGGGHSANSLQRIANAKNLTYGQQKDLIEKLSDPNNHDFDEELAEGTPRTREKFAGLISDTVWKNNPNSDYNKQNNKYPQMSREAYEDQRQYFLHRKNLAENIEKARRADDNKIKEKELADKREKEAQALRAINKKKYMEKKKSIKMQQMLQNQEDEEGDIQLRDGRTRVVNVQMISQEMFSVSTNFVMPEEIVNMMR